MSNGVWIIAEQREGKLKKVSFELLTIGRKLASKIGEPLAAVLLGYGVDNLARELEAYGPDKIFVCDVEILKNYSNEG
jgi:electron transfer flavoprotein alpha subunit